MQIFLLLLHNFLASYDIQTSHQACAATTQKIVDCRFEICDLRIVVRDVVNDGVVTKILQGEVVEFTVVALVVF